MNELSALATELLNSLTLEQVQSGALPQIIEGVYESSLADD